MIDLCGIVCQNLRAKVQQKNDICKENRKFLMHQWTLDVT